ncbi:probable G-protein coupled receptor No18 [Melanaphis sacchari]|uniref:probable G-protein coupled receptor No18 n=1 Tax=Melanaphis sacchari TaxID=742174 RepID=UPI000DC147F5|nr:probable G-protein coupled receptor No18 [Melanaphis sacchari]XP_025193461.1 probable G-protein coupled receptor No18 [Melanaphis sacchari]
MEKMYFNESHLPDDGFSSIATSLMTVHMVLVAIVGTTANLCVFLALSMSHKVSNNLLLLNLCVADSMVCIISGPLTVLSWEWPALSSYAIVNAVQYIPVAASTLSLMTQSIDRYSSIKHPRHNRLHRDKRPAYLVSGALAAWTVAAVVSVPRYAWPVHRLMADARWTRYYETCYVAVVFAVPWAAVAFTQRAVSRTLYITSLKAAAARGQLPLPMPIMTAECKQVILVASIQKNTTVQSKVTNNDAAAIQQPQPQQQPHASHQQAQQEQQQPHAEQQQQPQQSANASARSRKRLAKVLVALAGVFVACWLPYAAALLYANWFYSSSPPSDGDGGDGGAPPAVHRLATVAAMLLGHTHSAVNPVAYWWLNRHTLRACPWCWCSLGDQSDDDRDHGDRDTGCGGALGCIVSGAAAAFGCGRGDGSCGGSGAADCGGGAGCRQSQNHTPTRLNRLLFHRQPNNHQRSRQPSSTNEAALGPFNPRFATPKKPPQQLPPVKNPVMLYYA